MLNSTRKNEKRQETNLRKVFRNWWSTAPSVSSAFGQQRQRRIELARSEDETLKWTCIPQLKSFKIIGEDMATFSLNQTEILWVKPKIVGACFLDLSKTFRFEFHYSTMKNHFNCKLLYSDTDSFVYQIWSNEFYADLRRKTAPKDLLEFSSFYSDHEIHDRDNARVTLKFQDEIGGKQISEFVGLKPKLYSKTADGENTFKFFIRTRKD